MEFVHYNTAKLAKEKGINLMEIRFNNKKKY